MMKLGHASHDARSIVGIIAEEHVTHASAEFAPLLLDCLPNSHVEHASSVAAPLPGKNFPAEHSAQSRALSWEEYFPGIQRVHAAEDRDASLKDPAAQGVMAEPLPKKPASAEQSWTLVDAKGQPELEGQVVQTPWPAEAYWPAEHVSQVSCD
jgi:hypothetical protein